MTGVTKIIGNRVPKDFFITRGKGESNITIHAGSYHLALKDAGIECYNIMTYSSILPGIAREVRRPNQYTHGAVMETISAVSNGKRGQIVTSGIIFGWLYNKKTGKRYGGLVCEYNGNLTEKAANKQLRQSLNELYTNGFSEDYDLSGIRNISESFKVKKKYGTALVAICFVNHVIPILE